MGILTEPLLDEGQLTDYAGQLEILKDDDFVAEVAKQILDAGYSPRVTVADQKAGIGYTEAQRRESPWLYARAYNSAARDAGVPLDATDHERERAPSVAVAVAA